jgi:hypothetical protein
MGHQLSIFELAAQPDNVDPRLLQHSVLDMQQWWFFYFKWDFKELSHLLPIKVGMLLNIECGVYQILERPAEKSHYSHPVSMLNADWVRVIGESKKDEYIVEVEPHGYYNGLAETKFIVPGHSLSPIDFSNYNYKQFYEISRDFAEAKRLSDELDYSDYMEWCNLFSKTSESYNQWTTKPKYLIQK